MRNVILIIALFLLHRVSLGQEKEYNFINFNSKDGLASNTINAIHKDKYGFMWFGTEDGLNRFDGQNFTAYKHRENDTNSIGRGGVMAIVEDKNDNLWIGTNVTLSVYNRSLNNFTNYDFTQIGWIRSLCVDHLGNIWVGSYKGLFYFNTKTKKIKSYMAQPSNDKKLKEDLILCVFEDSKKNIWVGTKAGLHLFNSKDESFKRYFHQNKKEHSISDNIIRTIAEDKKGDLWIGTDLGGLNVMNRHDETFKSFKKSESDKKTLSSNRIFKIVFDKDGKLWVGTEMGVNIFDPSDGQILRIKSHSLNKYNVFGSFVGYGVRDICIDKAGIYWISTFQGGVNKYDSNLAFFNYKSYNPFDFKGLAAASVTSLTENPLTGDVFVGTDGGGLNVFDYKTNNIRHFALNGTNGKAKTVLALEKVEDALWVGTYHNGLFEVNLKNNSVKQVIGIKDTINNALIPINCLRGDRNGNLWIGTNGNGLYRYNTKSRELIPFAKLLLPRVQSSLPLNGFITTIEEDKEGNIWIGTNGSGIAVFNPTQKKVEILNHGNSKLPMDRVLNIYSASDGKIWVGIGGGGLCQYEPKSKSFHQYSENHLLSNSVIYKILEDNTGKLWVSTNKGISMFYPDKKRFKNYTYHNGIQQSTFNLGAGLKSSTGLFYFGGLDGFNFFNPKNLYQNTNTPPLVFTDLKINNKRANPQENSEISNHLSIAKEINLSYKQNFSLDFVALNYTAPQESQYSYKLEGFDKEWNNVGSITTAGYTNLDPGQYIFRLKARSEDGSWQTSEKKIVINVNPPFWRTYYAYFLYLAVIIITLWLIRRRGIQKLKNEFALAQERLEVKHLIEKERNEAERKMELDQLKIKFITNLSHELKTPLTLILNPIENLLLEEKSIDKIKILTLINRNSKRLLNLVNQLLDFRKIEENELKLHITEQDFIAFVKEIFDSFKYISERKNIHLNFESSINEYYTNFDRDKVERILINILSNAIKFTNENGNVYCKIACCDTSKGIKLIIGDSGIGMPEGMQARIFDRFFQIENSDNILNQGSGIGLSITQEFVKLHGGTISLKSEENIGSVFTISLPFIQTTPYFIQENTTDEILQLADSLYIENNEIEQTVIEKPVILIIDDSEDLRAYLRESLKVKYKIIEASDGKQGWQKTLALHPKIIISDVNMPNMDGITMVNKIKSDNRTKHIPVILLTVLGDEIEQLKGLETGANDYLTKPFSLRLLNLKINNLLSLNSTLKSTYSKHINLDVPEKEIVLEDEKFLLKIGRYIEDRILDPELSIEDLSQKMNMSRGTLYNKILSITGETPVEYIRSVRLKKAITLLEKSDMKISQIAYEVGFSNSNYFARAFRAKYGMTSSEYIKLKRV